MYKKLINLSDDDDDDEKIKKNRKIKDKKNVKNIENLVKISDDSCFYVSGRHSLPNRSKNYDSIFLRDVNNSEERLNFLAGRVR